MGKNNGFTLLELTIVVSIILLFSAFSIANYTSFNEEKKLEQEAKKIVDTLNLASKKASSGDSSCIDFRGYQVTFTTLNYTLQSLCAPPGQGPTPTPVQTQTLPLGLAITPPSPSTILFKPLTSGTNLSSTATITVKLSTTSQNKCISITVSTIGTVTEEPKVPC